jgi:hypothetical protein
MARTNGTAHAVPVIDIADAIPIIEAIHDAPAPDRPTLADVDIASLLQRRAAIEARKKAAVEAADAQIAEIDARLMPMFNDEIKLLAIPGYTVTRVAASERVSITWDIDKALADASPERRRILEVQLAPYRVTKSTTVREHLRATRGKL